MSLKIQYVSDLHVEFHKDNGKALIDELEPVGDVLVLAGDIVCWSQSDLANEFFNNLCQKFHCPIVYVLGNHEYYGSDPVSVHKRVADMVNENHQIRWLCRGSFYEFDGVRFIGDTLWFPRPNPMEEVGAVYMSDFFQIKRFEQWVYDHNRLAKKWIKSKATHNIIVTHHLPSPRLISKEFIGSPLNPFFVCNMEDAIEKSPLAWIYGHTHIPNTYEYCFSRMYPSVPLVCNPFGYSHENRRAEDFATKIIEV